MAPPGRISAIFAARCAIGRIRAIIAPAAPAVLRLALACLAVAALAGCTDRAAKLAALNTDAVVLAFGDSLTYGTGAPPEASYPAALEKLIGRKIHNAGVPGEVTAAGLERLPGVLEEVQPQLLILCHGGNDFLRKLGDAQAAANLRAMIRLAQEKGITVVLVAVPKPGLLLKSADLYDEIAKEYGLAFDASALKDILSDSALKSDIAHPNAKGYAQLAQAIAKLLKKNGAV